MNFDLTAVRRRVIRTNWGLIGGRVTVKLGVSVQTGKDCIARDD